MAVSGYSRKTTSIAKNLKAVVIAIFRPIYGCKLTALISTVEIALGQQNGSTAVSVYGRKIFVKSSTVITAVKVS